MSPEDEARIRAEILGEQKMAAYFERKGANCDGAYEPRSLFDKAEARMATVERLQRQLVAAGLPREPERYHWQFDLP